MEGKRCIDVPREELEAALGVLDVAAADDERHERVEALHEDDAVPFSLRRGVLLVQVGARADSDALHTPASRINHDDCEKAP